MKQKIFDFIQDHLGLCCILFFSAIIGVNWLGAKSTAEEVGHTTQVTLSAAYVEAETAHSSETEDQKEIVAYTPNGWPVYEDDILPPPEEYIYDEYGVMYQLVDGTYDRYEIVEDYQEEIETPESTAFTRILYWPYFEELCVEFRNSGAWYIYYDVPVEVWYSFKTAESKGSFFNSEIKGQYEYDREY